MLSMMANPA